jgi:hypothetical protein
MRAAEVVAPLDGPLVDGWVGGGPGSADGRGQPVDGRPPGDGGPPMDGSVAKSAGGRSQRVAGVSGWPGVAGERGRCVAGVGGGRGRGLGGAGAVSALRQARGLGAWAGGVGAFTGLPWGYHSGYYRVTISGAKAKLATYDVASARAAVERRGTRRLRRSITNGLRPAANGIRGAEQGHRAESVLARATARESAQARGRGENARVNASPGSRTALRYT